MIALLCSGILWHSPPWNRSGLERPIGVVQEARTSIGERDASFASGTTHFEGSIFDQNGFSAPYWWNIGTGGGYRGITGHIYYFGPVPLRDLKAVASFGAYSETYAGMGDHGDDAFDAGNYYELSCQPVTAQ